ncbi:MAG: hypothetical protein EXR71_19775 [Myxococcales bacterium]|nr:hypothetical protein [Myxococcales bacterium]
MAPPPSAPRGWLAALSLLSFAACATTAWTALGGIAHVQDEQAYLFQARLYAQLMTSAPSPADGALLAAEFQQLSPRWFGVFPPGWPMILAVGAGVGAPWLVNPLLAATLPWLTWAAFARALRREEALLACAVAASSPGILALGASMMSHTLVLACGLAAVAAIAAGRAGLAGAAVGMVILARPLDGLVLGGPLLVWGTVSLRRARMLAGPAVATMVLLATNQLYTGSPFVFAVDQYFAQGTDWGVTWRDGCNRLGFGADRGCMGRYARAGYTVAMGLEHLGANARFFDRLLIGVPGGAAVAAVGAVLALRRRALPVAVLVAAIAGPLAYGLYWYHGVAYGARFWHGLYLAALPALGVILGWRPRLGAVVLLTGVAFTFPKVWNELADDYWCVPAGLDDALASAGVTEGVVLLDAEGKATRRWPLTKYNRFDCEAWYPAGAGLGQNVPGGGGLVFLRAPGSAALVHPGNDAPPIEASLADVEANHPGAPIYKATMAWGVGWRVEPGG